MKGLSTVLLILMGEAAMTVRAEVTVTSTIDETVVAGAKVVVVNADALRLVVRSEVEDLSDVTVTVRGVRVVVENCDAASDVVVTV